MMSKASKDRLACLEDFEDRLTAMRKEFKQWRDTMPGAFAKDMREVNRVYDALLDAQSSLQNAVVAERLWIEHSNREVE
jgi:hypothetical protein